MRQSETTLVDVTIRVQVAEYERDYLGAGSQLKETPAVAAMRMVRAGYLRAGERIMSAEEVR